MGSGAWHLKWQWSFDVSLIVSPFRIIEDILKPELGNNVRENKYPHFGSSLDTLSFRNVQKHTYDF